MYDCMSAILFLKGDIHSGKALLLYSYTIYTNIMHNTAGMLIFYSLKINLKCM
jgi:hypothetical protein